MEHAARSRRAGPAQPRVGACVPRENRAGGRWAQRRYRPSSQNGVGPGGAVWLGAGVRQARGGLAHLCQGRVSSPFGPAGPTALRSQVPQAETNPSTFLAPRRVNRRWRGAPQSGRAAPPPRARRLRQRWPRRSAGLAPQNAAAEHAPVPRGHGAHRCLQRWMLDEPSFFYWAAFFSHWPSPHARCPAQAFRLGAPRGLRPCGVGGLAEGCRRAVQRAAITQASGSLRGALRQ